MAFRIGKAIDSIVDAIRMPVACVKRAKMNIQWQLLVSKMGRWRAEFSCTPASMYQCQGSVPNSGVQLLCSACLSRGSPCPLASQFSGCNIFLETPVRISEI
jgi:hypothetical protein